MTQPANGEWYLATDGKWYCWPDPTPHDEPPAAQAAPPAPPAPPSPEPTPPAPPVGYGAPAFGSPASPGQPGGAGYGAPADPGAPGAPGTPGYGAPGGFGVPTGYVQTGGGPAATLAADGNATKIALGGGALVALGSFLPWIKVSTPFGSVSRSGMDGSDGYLTLVLGLAIAAVALGAILKWALPSWTIWVPLSAGVLAFVLALIDFFDVRGAGDEFGAEAEGFASISVGVGLYAILLGAIVAAVGGWLMRQSR